MKQYDAIVIGAGIGGLASALLLAESGKKVALFEKTARTGGRRVSAHVTASPWTTASI